MDKEEILLEVRLSYEAAAKGIGELTVKNENLRKEIDNVKKALAEELKTADDARAARERAASEIAELEAHYKNNANAIRTFSTEMVNGIKYEKEATDSYNQLSAQLSVLTTEYNKMGEAERESAKGKDVQQQMSETLAKMKELKEAYGDHRLSVGDYEKATKNLRAEIAQYTDQLVKLTRENKAGGKEYKETAVKIKELRGVMDAVNKSTKDTEEKQKSLKTQLRDVTAAMQEMAAAGKQNTAEYAALSVQAGEFKKSINAVNKEIALQGDSTLALSMVSNAVRGVVGAYGVWQSASALLGVENKELDTVMKNLQATMTALMSINAVYNTFIKKGGVLTQIAALQSKMRAKALASEAAAQQGATAATGKATIAQAKFNVVAWMNPYVLLAAALAGLIIVLTMFSKKTDEAAKEQKELNDVTKNAADIYGKEFGNLTRLVAVISTYAKGTKERTDAIKKINSEYGAYLENLLTENSTLAQITAVYEELIPVLEKQAVMKAWGNSIETESVKLAEIQMGKEQRRMEIEGEMRKNKVRMIELERTGNTIMREYGELVNANTVLQKNLSALETDEIKQKEALKIATKNYAKALKEVIDMNKQNADVAARSEAYSTLLKKLEDFKKTESDKLKEGYDADIDVINDFRKQEIAAINARYKDLLEAAKNYPNTVLVQQQEVLNKKIAAINEEFNKQEIDRKTIYNAELAKLGQSSVNERIDAEKKLQDLTLSIMKDGQEKEFAQLQLAYDRDLEAFKGTATQKAEYAKKREQQYQQERATITEKYSKEEYDKAIERAQAEIDLRIELAKEGSKEELSLMLSKLDNQMIAELQEAEQLGIEKQLIYDKYDRLRKEANTANIKAIYEQELEQSRIAWETKIAEAQLKGQDELNIKIQQKQAELEIINQMIADADEESKAELLLRQAQFSADIKAMQDDVAQNQVDNAMKIAAAMGSMFGAMSDLLNEWAEDNEAMAAFSKALAMMEIQLQMAVGIATAVVEGMKAGWPAAIAYIAAGIAAVVAGIASSMKLLKQQNTPKAPKMAKGGLVSGAGSGTSDNVPTFLSNGESVMTAQTTGMFAPLLSQLNTMGGGVPIGTTDVAKQAFGEDVLSRSFAKALEKMPQPVVAVQDINDAQGKYAGVTGGGNFGANNA